MCTMDLQCFRQSSPMNLKGKVDLLCMLDVTSGMIEELHIWMDKLFFVYNKAQ